MTSKISGVKFSVVIPAYSRPKLLQRALRSVAAQTSQPAEVIVVIDGEPYDFDELDELSRTLGLNTHEVSLAVAR